MEDDIRLYDSFIAVIEGKERRVYEYDGYWCWLSKTYKNGEHAEVCLYSVKTPEGEIIKDIDLNEANSIIFYSNYNEKYPSDNYELDLMDNR